MGRPIPPTRSSGVCSTTNASSSAVCLPTCSTDRCWRCAWLSLATVQPCSKSGRAATSRPSCPTASPPLIPPPISVSSRPPDQPSASVCCCSISTEAAGASAASTVVRTSVPLWHWRPTAAWLPSITACRHPIPFRLRSTTAAAPLPISASTPMRGVATLPRWRWEATAPEATLPLPQPSRPRV